MVGGPKPPEKALPGRTRHGIEPEQFDGEMIISDALGVEGLSLYSTPLLKVHGVGKQGFWSLVNRLTHLDLGGQFNEEWKRRLVILRREWRIVGEFPYT